MDRNQDTQDDTDGNRRLRTRIRDGDADTFANLFDTYARSVYNHAYRLNGDWSLAEDIVSLTFLEAWRLRERIAADGGSLRPWLLGIATNVTRTRRRAARRHASAMARLPREGTVPDFADDIVGRIDDAAQLGQVHTALAALRRPEREILALCVWDDLDYAEAARTLGIPVGTVRSRLSRARRKLAAALESGTGSGQTGSAPARVPEPLSSSAVLRKEASS
ncbi:RNA polymerase sigma factor [Streptomyces sp. NPDC059479]|uniref:RNA polymerase sigma factor n=1 Tax=Streptomyces sp. NPDC059479 TaxID=3346848 RepID=UPI003692D2D7